MFSLTRCALSRLAVLALLAFAILGSARVNSAELSLVPLSRPSDESRPVTWAAASTPAMSRDGRYVAFASNATDLVPGTSGRTQVYVRDRILGGVELVSRSLSGAPVDGFLNELTLSGDGRCVVYNAFVSGPSGGGTEQVYLYDRSTGHAELISAAPDGTPSNRFSGYKVAVRDDGRYVAFVSYANNLIARESNGRAGIFVRDRNAHVTVRVGLGPGGVEGNQDSGLTGIAISGNGRYVAFSSRADNLVPGDTNRREDIFVSDRETGSTERISGTATGAESNGEAIAPGLSEDGRYVVFWSIGTNMLSPPYQGPGIFVRDRARGTTELESVSPDRKPVGGNFGHPGISPDGMFVAFSSDIDLIEPQGNRQTEEVFLRDRARGVTERISVPVSADPPGDVPRSDHPAISSGGRYVAFESWADNLVVEDSNARSDVFVRDRSQHATERISETRTLQQCVTAAWSGEPAMSPDGRLVTFVSDAINLVPGQQNGLENVYLLDREKHTLERVNVSSLGQLAARDGPVYYRTPSVPAVTPDGRYVVFTSHSSNLHPDAVSRYSSPYVFLRDRVRGSTELVSRDADGKPLAATYSFNPAVSADGRFVAFVSTGAGVPGDTNGVADVFVRDRQSGSTERISVSSSGAQQNGPVDFVGSPAISADGRFVAFASQASNLVPDDTNHAADVFVRDRQNGLTERVSVTSEGGQTEGGVDPWISADGRFVSFHLLHRDRFVGDIDGAGSAAVRDRGTGRTELLDGPGSGVPAAWASFRASISPNGRYAAFLTNSAEPQPGGDGPRLVVHITDRKTRRTDEVRILGGLYRGGVFTEARPLVTNNGRLGLLVGRAKEAQAALGGTSDIYLAELAGPGPLAVPVLLHAWAAERGVNLFWVPSSPERAGFKIERKSGAGPFEDVGRTEEYVTRFEDATAQPSVAYVYRVRSLGEDEESPPSPEAGVTTRPAARGELSAPDHLHFGRLRLREASIARSVTLRNLSHTESLRVAIAVSGAGFSLDAPERGFTLPPRGQWSFAVRFAPASTKSFVGAVVVQTSDPARPAVSIALSGTGR